MNKPTAFVIASLFAALAATAQAQAQAPAPAKAPPAAQATDPVVQMRAEERAAHQVYEGKVSAARKEREAEMRPSIDAAVKQATDQGKDPMVAKRDAEKKAREATRKSYKAKVDAAKKERDAAIAAARKKGGVGKS